MSTITEAVATFRQKTAGKQLPASLRTKVEREIDKCCENKDDVEMLVSDPSMVKEISHQCSKNFIDEEYRSAAYNLICAVLTPDGTGSDSDARLLV